MHCGTHRCASACYIVPAIIFTDAIPDTVDPHHRQDDMHVHGSTPIVCGGIAAAGPGALANETPKLYIALAI